jgi:hypothetical protein
MAKALDTILVEPVKNVLRAIRSLFSCVPNRVATPSFQRPQTLHTSHIKHIKHVSNPRSSTQQRVSALFTSNKNKFPLFTQLPPEIRLKIWAYALKIPLHAQHPDAGLYYDDHRYTLIAVPQWKWPPLLAVCRESRLEAIHYYEGLLGPLSQFKDLGAGEPLMKKIDKGSFGRRRCKRNEGVVYDAT